MIIYCEYNKVVVVDVVVVVVVVVVVDYKARKN